MPSRLKSPRKARSVAMSFEPTQTLLHTLVNREITDNLANMVAQRQNCEGVATVESGALFVDDPDAYIRIYGPRAIIDPQIREDCTERSQTFADTVDAVGHAIAKQLGAKYQNQPISVADRFREVGRLQAHQT